MKLVLFLLAMIAAVAAGVKPKIPGFVRPQKCRLKCLLGKCNDKCKQIAQGDKTLKKLCTATCYKGMNTGQCIKAACKGIKGKDRKDCMALCKKSPTDKAERKMKRQCFKECVTSATDPPTDAPTEPPTDAPTDAST